MSIQAKRFGALSVSLPVSLIGPLPSGVISKSPRLPLRARVCQKPPRVPIYPRRQLPACAPCAFKSGVPVKRIEEGIPEGLAKMLQSHQSICTGTSGTRRPVPHWPQKPTKSKPHSQLSIPRFRRSRFPSRPRDVLGTGQAHPGLRAAHSPLLLASQNPGQRHRTLQGCGGKRDRSRRPFFWGSVLRSNGTRPAGTQALGD